MASNADSGSPGLTTAEEWKDSLKDWLIDSGAVENTRERLASGTYADGSLVKLAGVACVGKTIHTGIFATDNFRKQFTQKCLQLGQLRHPHLVQLLGVQLSDGAIPPVLVFEHLPLSLASCLQKYSCIPDHASYTILLEVSHALQFLHEQKPPLVHGHLFANNVLLTEALHVKISDVVRFGAPVPSQPNAPYHPPEDTPSESGDIFSFGDLIIHVTLQREPSPLEAKQHPKENHPEENVTLTELQRREKFISEMGESHLLRELASNCLQDEPSLRPKAASVAQELAMVSAKHPPEHQNILDVFAVLGQLTLSKETVASLNRALEAKQEEIEGLKDQIDPLKLELESKNQVLAAEKQEVEAYKQALLSKEGRIKAYETGLRAKDALAKAKDREIAAKKQDLAAKDNLLKAAHNRIEVLEHQVSSSKKKVIYPPRSAKSPSPGASSERGISPQTSMDDTSGVLMRRNKGRMGRGNISSDGYMYQGFMLQRSRSMSQGEDGGSGRDPVLAKIFARQQQKITDAESMDSIREKKAATGESGAQADANVSREAKSQSSTRDEPTPELKRILDKRKSFLDDDNNN